MTNLRTLSVALLVLAALLRTGGDARAEIYTARVVAVPSSDILEIEAGTSTRLVVLHGILAPSTRSPFSSIAKSYLKDRVGEREISIESIAASGGLDYVKVRSGPGPNTVNEELLERGLAKWDTLSAPNDKTYRALQAKAKAGSIGIWSNLDPRLDVPHEYDLSMFGMKISVHLDTNGVKTLSAKGDGEQEKIVGFEARVLAQRAQQVAEILREQEARQREMDKQREKNAAYARTRTTSSSNSGFGRGRIRVRRQTIMDLNGNIIFSGVTTY